MKGILGPVNSAGNDPVEPDVKPLSQTAPGWALIAYVMTDYLAAAYPAIASVIPKVSIANLPTPVSHHRIETSAGSHSILVKHDELTNDDYGGNKIRKLEYILQRALDRGARRVATFGAAGSNHALATAVHARAVGLDCLCFLAHQKRTPNIASTLNKHLELGTTIVRYGGSIDKLRLFRQHLQATRSWVVPLGGTCWYGAVGFVGAGLELAAQIETGEVECPQRIYVANGTMGTVAGLSVGLALADLPTEVHAVRVADNRFTNPRTLQRLVAKTAELLRRYEPAIATNLAARTRIVWRDEFFAGGYAAVDRPTRNAVRFAADNLGLTLETTYTGKAMAALINDLKAGAKQCLFWNTYGGLPRASSIESCPLQGIPLSFRRYFDR